MFLGGFGEREGEAFFVGEGERDAAVLRGVGAGEETGVVAVLHVLAVGLEHAGVGAGLRKHFAEHGEIKPERGSEAETLGESGGVDIHDHVDQSLHLRGLAGGADVAERNAEIFEGGFRALECGG